MDTAAYASLCQLAILVGYCTNPQYIALQLDNLKNFSFV
jgi:hypothetical protein